MEICSAVCLFERQCGTAYLKAFDPPDADVDEEVEILLANCFTDLPVTDLIFTFTTDHNFCYTMIFGTLEHTFSIVILSEYVIPRQIFVFLNQVRAFLSDLREACVILDHVYESLRKWSVQNGCLDIPGNELEPLQQNSDVTGFNPFTYFEPLITVPTLWRTILSGGNILLHCPDPLTMSSAVFSVMSLVYPLAYRDPVMICASNEDPRLLRHHFEGIVAVIGNAPIDESMFHCVAISARNNRAGDTSADEQNLATKMTRVKRTIDSILNRQLMTNPYSDILEYPVVADDLGRYYPDEKMREAITIGEVRRFENTETFRQYRRSVTFREAFRQAFLSMDAATALRGKSAQHIKEILEKIKELEVMPEFVNDEHFQAVLHQHKKFARKRMREL